MLWDDIDFSEGMFLMYVSLPLPHVSKKRLHKRSLAPYESSLLPLPHQLLILMKAPQTRFLLADVMDMDKTIEAGLALKELKLRVAI